MANMQHQKPLGMYILDAASFNLLYGPQERADLAGMVDFLSPESQPPGRFDRSLLRRTEVLFSGWGGPLLDEEFLDAAPALKAVFYGAGSLASFLTDAVWDRGLTVTSAITANAKPVAEYTLASIIFSLKHAWRLAREEREGFGARTIATRNSAQGCYGSTVGVISMGTVARILLRLLKPMDLRVIVWDPFLTAAEAQSLGVELVSLPELFERADVVSLHTPLLPETEGLIGGRHLRSMKSGATFINTARAQIVLQSELAEVAASRPDLQFILDVTEPDPLPADSELLQLPNVFATPHIAGSVGAECLRMGRYMVQELERFLTGKALQWEVTREAAWGSSHRSVHDRRPVSNKSGVEVFVNPLITGKPAVFNQV